MKAKVPSAFMFRPEVRWAPAAQPESVPSSQFVEIREILIPAAGFLGHVRPSVFVQTLQELSEVFGQGSRILVQFAKDLQVPQPFERRLGCQSMRGQGCLPACRGRRTG